ncbi:MAG: AMP-binding protein [Desulfobulbaceae bacterium]|nr:AMP-binding protein [Desulfobulbaceae bacterium]
MDYNIANALRRVAATQGTQTALIAKEGRRWHQWSFAELRQHSEGFAAALQTAGVAQGDRVMLMVRPSLEFICLTFALFQLGAVVILIDPGMGYKNLLRCIGGVRPDILVGIPKAILFSRIFRTPFATVRKRICVGRSLLNPGSRIDRFIRLEPFPHSYQAQESDPAAIIFTTGSTGPPKGVLYTHGIFHAQLGIIRDYYGIGPGDIDQPGFPLFGLFATALGATAVIPDMDPTRPAQVNPVKFVRTLIRHQVSYSFGSPAIWNVVSRYCLERQIVLPVKKVLMAGAPVSGELVERVQRILPADSQIFTPYGATESLPVASIEGEEIVQQTWPLTRTGRGTCVGRALPGIGIRIIAPVDGPIASWSEVVVLSPGTIGEIVVQGPVVTRSYVNNANENQQAKIFEGQAFWHRMGDMGWLDDQQRLWFCGRKAHRVHTVKGVLYTVPCEAIFNEHPLVRRSALVGLGAPGTQQPVIVVEPCAAINNQALFFTELRGLAQANKRTEDIELFLIHPEFPVDIRHNAKIFREKLTDWACRKLQLPTG